MGEPAGADPPVEPARPPRRILSGLAPELAAGLSEVMAAAEARGVEVWLVGGALRDALREASVSAPGDHSEVDLMVVDGLDALAEDWPLAGGALKRHDRFGTLTWSDGRVRMDLVRARTERYSAPGRLPDVTPGDLTADLGRRDFSVNAMAMALTGPRRGTVVDEHGGRADLRAGLIRALHPGSFSDDPTRAFRALRYAVRLGFRLDPATREQIPLALALLPSLSGRRVASELLWGLAEPRAAEVISAFDAQGLLSAVHPGLSAGALGAGSLAGDHGRPPAGDRLALWLAAHGPGLAGELAARLDLPAAEHDAIAACASLAAALRPGAPADQPVDALLALDRASGRARSLLRAGLPPERADQLAPLFEALARRPLLDGEALAALGVPTGPAMGRLARALRAAQLRGELADEVAARNWLAAGDAAPAPKESREAHHGP